MTGRRKTDKWTKWIQVSTVVFSLAFVIVIGYGLNAMFKEIETITRGQQELILNLTQKSIEKQKEPSVAANSEELYVSKVSFIKYKNQTSREIRDLKRQIALLKQQLKPRKSPL